MNDALAALEDRVRADLARTAHPEAAWLTPRLAPGDRPALDVLIVGAGQSGLATAFGLLRSQVSNILVLDKSEEGQEGPWLTYARMHTLRSPKHFTGPDLDIPSLTYQSWHEARFGEEDWRKLDLISRERWAEYLLWFRRIVDVPVRNGCEVVEISPAPNGLLAAKVQTADGLDTLFARKIVLATGQEGMGDWTVPEPLRHLPTMRCAHAAQPIDFVGLRGKRVAVIGGGNSGVEAAIDLAGIVSHVTLIEFDSKLRADAVLQKKMASLPNVTVIMSALTKEVLGAGGKVNGLRYQDRTNNSEHTLELEGIFVQIGLLPNTDWLKGTLDLSKHGEVIVDAKGETSLPGVFAAGDCTTVPYKQIIIAMGEGAKASLGAFDYLIRSSVTEPEEALAA